MSDESEEDSESEFYYPDESEFDGDLTEINNERVGERQNEGNSQEEIETFVKEQKLKVLKTRQRKQTAT